jgi:arylsulfatase
MVANIDDNVGKLMTFLDEKKLAENTVVIFFHDNGGTAGVNVFNAGLRGRKTTYYEGGHRAACFIRGPRAVLGRLPADIGTKLTLVQDLFPTLIDWCGLPTPRGAKFDGHTLARMIAGGDAYFLSRMAVVQFGESPGGAKLEKFNACVLWNDFDLELKRHRQWRLVHGKELYELDDDPGQKADIAAKHPDVVKKLRDHYETWWAEVGPKADDYVPVVIGSDKENPVTLTSADWAGTYADNVPRDVRGGLNKNGPWHVKVEQDGEYEIRLRRWPAEADAALDAGVPAFKAVDGQLPAGKALPVAAARLKVGDFDRTLPAPAGAKEVVFTVPLKATAKTQMQTWLRDAAGNDLCGAYYAYVKRKNKD